MDLWEHLLDLGQIRKGSIPKPQQTGGPSSPAAAKTPNLTTSTSTNNSTTSPEEETGESQKKKKNRQGGKNGLRSVAKSSAPTTPIPSGPASSGAQKYSPPTISRHSTYRDDRPGPGTTTRSPALAAATSIPEMAGVVPPPTPSVQRAYRRAKPGLAFLRCSDSCCPQYDSVIL